MYARIGASEPIQTSSVPGAPFCSVRTSRTPASSATSPAAANRYVRSVLALSATVMRNGYGNVCTRWACSRRTHAASVCCSLYTGTTTSRTG